jgi:hypothetical protein
MEEKRNASGKTVDALDFGRSRHRTARIDRSRTRLPSRATNVQLIHSGVAAKYLFTNPERQFGAEGGSI